MLSDFRLFANWLKNNNIDPTALKIDLKFKNKRDAHIAALALSGAFREANGIDTGLLTPSYYSKLLGVDVELIVTPDGIEA